VVNDGSNSECDYIFEALKEMNCDVLTHSENLGKGAALKTAINYAIFAYPDSYGIVTADADGQHTAQDIFRVAERLTDNIVIGTRDFHNKKVPFKSKWGNKITTFVFWLKTGVNLCDTQTGLRAIPMRYAPIVLQARGNRFEYEMNMLLLLCKMNIPITAIPIETVYSDNNSATSFRAVRDSVRIYWDIIKFGSGFSLKKHIYAVLFTLFLTSVFVFTLLDAFVFPKTMQVVSPPETRAQTEQADALTERITTHTEQIDPVITDSYYKDENIEISVDTLRVHDTDVYIADVKINDVSYLKAAFANNAYGRNVNEKTSVIAEEHNAIFAVNGDYYGFRDDGWVLRNGDLYRSSGNDTSLLMDSAGDFSVKSGANLTEKNTSGFWQIWTFGPPLVIGGEISVTENQEISGRSSNSNPRTAIGQIGELHYIFIVSDGRTKASAGLSLYELAELFKERDCSVAYNLDGGGSSTMIFNGSIINRPTTDGRRIVEREVSDIVYIGY